MRHDPRTGVKTIFAESSVNPKVEAGDRRASPARRSARSCGRTRSGPQGSDGATYIGSIESNTRALVEGFTGGPANCFVDA